MYSPKRITIGCTQMTYLAQFRIPKQEYETDNSLIYQPTYYHSQSSKGKYFGQKRPPRGGGINSTREKTGKKFSSREKVKN